MKYWILQEESGAYSQYSLNLLGLFSTPDLAKQWLDGHLEKIRARHPSNRVHQHGPWTLDHGDEVAESNAPGYHYSDLRWSIIGFEVDRPEGAS